MANEASPNGLRILKVIEASPAHKAGIRPGDILLSLAGQKVTTPSEARLLMFGVAGGKVDCVLQRENKELTFTLERAPYTEVFGKVPEKSQD